MVLGVADKGGKKGPSLGLRPATPTHITQQCQRVIIGQFTMESSATRSESVFKNYTTVMRILSEEVQHIIALARGQDFGTPGTAVDVTNLSVINRRLLVRSVCAFCEGLAYCLKQLPLSGLGAELTPIERALVLEEDYELDSNGRPMVRPARLKTLNNLRFALELLPRKMGASFAPEYSDHGWEALQLTIKVRDRITHPKMAGDLEISDDEIRNAVRAYYWLHSQNALFLTAALNRSTEIMTKNRTRPV